MPISARTVMTRSDHLPAFTAEITPTRIPNASQMIPAPIVSENVAGMSCQICESTGTWLVYETRLFVNMRCISFAYCT